MKQTTKIYSMLKTCSHWGKAGLVFLAVLLVFTSCARMGQPDGGWYDERPPRIVSCSPEEKGTNVKSKFIQINFNEYIKVDNPTEKVTISPPQIEQPEIKVTGKGIRIELKDSLKDNTTYTVDFSDAITDNNEGNPLGNYTYVFSTGEEIDTMEVAGYVLNAQNLEPIKGISVGLYKDFSDSIFFQEPLQRVGRTDGSGHFIIRGVAPGSYRIFALQDADGDYKLSQRGEMLAYSREVVFPSMKDDVRQDTTWIDSLHIKNITRTPYIHYLPDDVVLRAFTQEMTDRSFLKAERKTAEHFTLFFSNGGDELPTLHPLNFPEDSRMIVEASEKKDTITYWLTDSMLINQDTLRVTMDYLTTDTLGLLVTQTDTLEILSKAPYAKRMKAKEEELKKWEKKQEKLRKKGEEPEEEMPREALQPEYIIPKDMTPLTNVKVRMPVPLESIDTSAIHIYAKHDTLWYRSPMKFTDEGMPHRTYEIQGEWRAGTEYSIEVDSACFRDIYGRVSKAFTQGVKLPEEKQFSTLIINYEADREYPVIMQLLQSDNVISEARVGEDNTAQFFYLKPGTYYLRMIVDRNDNGRWDTGDYGLDIEPEMVYYWPEKIECNANWEVTKTVDPLKYPLYRQKPGAITKQKADAKRKKVERNAERARKKGILYVPEE